MDEIKLKLLGLNCAQGEAKNTAWLVQYVLKASEEFSKSLGKAVEVKVEFVDLADKEIKPFSGYYQWKGQKGGPVPLRVVDVPSNFGYEEPNDYMQTLWPKMVEADGIVFGSPVSVGSASSKFRILCERLTPRIAKGELTNKPVVLVSTGAPLIGGQESCLRAMGNCIRELEMIDVSWKIGVPGVAGNDSKALGVDKDAHAKKVAGFSAKRLVETAAMQKTAKQALGDMYKKEFIQVYHDVHPDQSWAWEKLNPKDAEWLMSRINSQKGEYSSFSLEGGW